MQIQFSEQDVIDACSVYLAHHHHRRPEDIRVDLQVDEIRGFSAEAKVGFRSVFMNEQEMIDGVALYLSEYHGFNPDELRIDLQFEEGRGIEAQIAVDAAY
jgi:hypothetical protein